MEHGGLLPFVLQAIPATDVIEMHRVLAEILPFHCFPCVSSPRRQGLLQVIADLLVITGLLKGAAVQQSDSS